LRQRLTVKYGKPIEQSGDVFSWELIEPITDATGQTVPFRTMWMTAYASGSGSGSTLEITLIDFRILWADQAAVNREPRKEAEDRIKF
jgi:hypothetical protein